MGQAHLVATAALLSRARSEFGFDPDRTYSGTCDLCNQIRLRLVMQCGVQTLDLQPPGLYRWITRDAFVVNR